MTTICNDLDKNLNELDSKENKSDFGPALSVIRPKQKLIETEPEPIYEYLTDQINPEPLELYVSLIMDYAQLKCDVNEIEFSNTNLYEKQIYRLVNYLSYC